uniref:Salivary secreted protein n=1 Tax=Panagrellus redivivus TaxID=6233 RepID=A0A7E4V4Q4_PANRE
MCGIFYTAVAIAVAGTIAQTAPSGTLDQKTKTDLALCKFSCYLQHGMSTLVSSDAAYDNLIRGMSAEDLYNTHCSKVFESPKCESNCEKRLKINNVENKTLPDDIYPFPTSFRIVQKNCYAVREHFTNLKPITECSKKIYPLIAKQEENEKCRKVCCSKPRDKASLYACNERPDAMLNTWITSDTFASKEDMCHFTCVIDQAARHANNKCSSLIKELLISARDDVLKLFQWAEQKVEEEQRG